MVVGTHLNESNGETDYICQAASKPLLKDARPYMRPVTILVMTRSLSLFLYMKSVDRRQNTYVQTLQSLYMPVTKREQQACNALNQTGSAAQKRSSATANQNNSTSDASSEIFSLVDADSNGNLTISEYLDYINFTMKGTLTHPRLIVPFWKHFKK